MFQPAAHQRAGLVGQTGAGLINLNLQDNMLVRSLVTTSLNTHLGTIGHLVHQSYKARLSLLQARVVISRPGGQDI